MLIVAFVCFAALIVAWLLAPTGGPQAEPVTPVTRTAMASESGSASLA